MSIKDKVIAIIAEQAVLEPSEGGDRKSGV